jgi:hypothetical protein
MSATVAENNAVTINAAAWIFLESSTVWQVRDVSKSFSVSFGGATDSDILSSPAVAQEVLDHLDEPMSR